MHYTLMIMFIHTYFFPHNYSVVDYDFSLRTRTATIISVFQTFNKAPGTKQGLSYG